MKNSNIYDFSTIKKYILNSIIFLLFVYGVLFIYETSVVVQNTRFFSLADDQMISMRYARNLAEGEGLRWNPDGKFVEGYTNPLWVAYMSLIHLTPVPMNKISVIIQLSGLIFLVLNLFVIKKLTKTVFEDDLIVLISVFFTAFYFPLINWSLQGFEVSILLFFISTVCLSGIKSMKKNEFRYFPYVILGIGTLVRMDIIIAFITYLTLMMIFQKNHRLEHLQIGISLFCLSLGSQTVFRYWYFGEIMPNTYDLKMTGYPVHLRILRGGVKYVEFVFEMGILTFFVAFLPLLMFLNQYTGLIISLFLTQSLYSIYVGGDAWEWYIGSNRFLSIVMPIFFVMMSGGIVLLIRKFYATEKKDLYFYGLVLLLVFFCFFNMNNISLNNGFKHFTFQNPPLGTDGLRNKINKALLIKSLTKDTAKIGVVWAGAIPYFSERYSIDFLGKTDPTIANESAHRTKKLNKWSKNKYFLFYPGHMKWDYSYSIGKFEPDIISSLWIGNKDLIRYLKEYQQLKTDNMIMYLRTNSDNIYWKKL